MAPRSPPRARARSAGAASTRRRTTWSRSWPPLPALPLPLTQPQAQHRPQRAPDLASRHLGGAGDAVLEPDRHLDHRIAEPAPPPHHLDLKYLPLRYDVI